MSGERPLIQEVVREEAECDEGLRTHLEEHVCPLPNHHHINRSRRMVAHHMTGGSAFPPPPPTTNLVAN
jgi:hypothetical protein